MQRKVRPIVGTTDDSAPRFTRTAEARVEWDAAMRNAIMAAKNARLYGGGENNCEGDFPALHGQMTMIAMRSTFSRSRTPS